MKVLLVSAAAFLVAAQVSAATLQFGTGSFDQTTDSWFFTDVASVGGSDVNLRVTTFNVPLDSFNEARNSEFTVNSLQANLAANAGNASTFLFNLVDDDENPVVLPDLTIGVYDLDFERREIITVFSPVSYTLTTETDLLVTDNLNGSYTFAGSTVGNVANVNDLSSLSVAQQDAAAQFNFGNASSFSLRAEIGPGPNSTGRNFFFGNFTFTEPTTTFVTPVPVPPAVALFAGAFALLGGVRLIGRRRSD